MKKLTLLILILSIKIFSQKKIKEIRFECLKANNEIVYFENKIFKNGKEIESFKIKEKNILSIEITENETLIIRGVKFSIYDLYYEVLKFLDNGGNIGINGKPCDYCQGERKLTSSEHPNKAYLLISNKIKKNEQMLTKITFEIEKAYNELSSRVFRKTNNTKSFKSLNCYIKNEFVNQYYPVNIIYNNDYVKIKENKKEPPKPKPISVGNNKL